MTTTLNTDKTTFLVESLVEQLNDRFKVDSIESGRSVYTQVEYESGRKYLKLWTYLVGNEGRIRGRSCYAFVEKETGNVYKPASYKAPAKGVRFQIDQLTNNPDICDQYGSFLYVR